MTTTTKLVLFVHIATAITAIGPAYAFPILGRVFPKDRPVSVLKVYAKMERIITVGLIIMLATGIWLIWLEHLNENFGHQGWLNISLLVYAALAVLGVSFNTPRIHKALKLTEQGDQESANRILAPMDKIVGPILGVLGLLIIFLMVYKPFVTN